MARLKKLFVDLATKVSLCFYSTYATI